MCPSQWDYFVRNGNEKNEKKYFKVIKTGTIVF